MITNPTAATNTLHFLFYKSASFGQYDNPKLAGAALSLTPYIASAAPEPSQVWGLGFAALGLGGLALKARRRGVQA